MSKNVMDSFSDVLRDYANGHLDYHFSSRHDGKRPHANVHHPDADRVHLLLAGLGDPNDTLTSWKDVFHSNEEDGADSSTTILVDFPGAGKTRLQFEAVAEHFLLYLNCSRKKIAWTAGSDDVSWAMDHNIRMRAVDNVGTARRTVQTLLFSRIYILSYFMDLILTNPDVTAVAVRRRFLLLQACPPASMLNAGLYDIFSHLVWVAQPYGIGVLEAATNTAMQRLCRSICRLLSVGSESPLARLHLLIDEAQYLTQDPFLYDASNTPFLSQLLNATDKFLKPRITLITGSALSLSRLEHALTVWKDGVGVTGVRCVFGIRKTMLNDDYVHNYIGRHMPELLSERRLLERIRDWLFPRPGLIAELLEIYKTAKLIKVRVPYHRLLSLMFANSSGYQPMDATLLEAKEEEIPNALLSRGFRYGMVELAARLNASSKLQDVGFLNTVCQICYRWILSSEATLVFPKDDAILLINLGITPLLRHRARTLKQFKADALDCVWSVEPFGVIVLISLLRDVGTDVFNASMRYNATFASEQAQKGYIFEKLVTLVLMDAFGREGSCVLNDVFRFAAPAPEWTKRRFRLVSLIRNDDGLDSVPVTWKSGASPRLGYKAREPSDVLGWMKDPKGIPFLFPDNNHRSDAVVIIEEVKSGQRSILAIQDKAGARFSFESAKESLDAPYSRKAKENRVCESCTYAFAMR
ncbi:hypothetical protein EV421DRAFT_236211 [Armillaria borealis]|uniref:Uncharacterized protein n=1 Tax=Armillaria borealis TaxID=47425 RepID=A0AA39MEU1_9AGAR|nr:hypothetical protein EV421DRAFT_236211 [Armillaria borealis]